MKKNFDFIVLGAGTAGCAAVRALTAKFPSAEVALVEAGSAAPPPPLSRVPALQPYLPLLPGRGGRALHRVMEGEPEPSLGGRRLRHWGGAGLGGSARVGDMRYLRGTREDWAAWGSARWAYDDAVLPAMRSLERNSRRAGPLHGGDGPLAVTDAARSNVDAPLNVRFYEACEAAGLRPREDLCDGEPADGFAAPQSLIDGRGARVDVYGALVGSLAARVQVLADTRAVALEWGDGCRVAGVRVVAGAAGEEVLRATRVVLCMGAIGNAEVLLRSGVGPGGAAADVAGVGENLIVGCAVDVVSRIALPEASRALSLRNLPRLRRQWREYREEGGGAFAALAEAVAFVRSSPQAPRADVSVALLPSAHVAWHGWRAALPADGFTVRVTLHYPVARGTVRLRGDPGAAGGGACVTTGLLSARQDVEALDDGLQWAALLTSHDSPLRTPARVDGDMNPVSPFAALRPALIHPAAGLRTQRDTAAFFAQNAFATADRLGTCAVGSVVDDSLAVRGVSGVWVADASVAPAPSIASSAVMGAAVATRLPELMRVED